MSEESNRDTRGSKACAWAKRLFILGVLLLVAGLIAPNLGISPMVVMLLLSLGLLFFIVAGISGGVGLIRSSGSGGGSSPLYAWLGVAAGVGAILNIVMVMGSAGGPPIHDITTDTENPPAFVAVAKLRGPKDNPVEYSGPEAAAQQKAAYADIKTIELNDPRSFVFTTALGVAEDMGWEIVAAEPEAGRIEATATTPFVGFKDDVVIRVQSRSATTLVDVRSKSRIGMGDMGVNAKRVREFRDRLIEAVEP